MKWVGAPQLPEDDIEVVRRISEHLPHALLDRRVLAIGEHTRTEKLPTGLEVLADTSENLTGHPLPVFAAITEHEFRLERRDIRRVCDDDLESLIGHRRINVAQQYPHVGEAI